MQQLENLPWYTYAILIIVIVSYIIRYFLKAKEGYDENSTFKAKFKKSANSTLDKNQLFAIAFYTPISEWWEADTNTLGFLKAKDILPYLEGWGIDTKVGYWDLTEYFMKDGRRWYFDFIYNMIQHEPKEQWAILMAEKFGTNERAYNYLDQLKTGETLQKLKQNGILTFDSELDLGVTAYDAAVLVGQARKAYTANIISEEEAWKVIQFARELAVQHFSSWDEFGKSLALGFALDFAPDRRESAKEYKEGVFHIYKQVVEDPASPWNTISWPKE
ncbi:DUF1266 domain-containing protein [Echinicola shivajiensis]|uniref:DUF1266 domain-containing protein n=1 Tax=Echinicola shivajiensis TaxID=1035916 RepID=UPI001BFC2B48|nr:DUF1266 domain-containing protein [Echinicola shivajiensis]